MKPHDMFYSEVVDRYREWRDGKRSLSRCLFYMGNLSIPRVTLIFLEHAQQEGLEEKLLREIVEMSEREL